MSLLEKLESWHSDLGSQIKYQVGEHILKNEDFLIQSIVNRQIPTFANTGFWTRINSMLNTYENLGRIITEEKAKYSNAAKKANETKKISNKKSS